MLRFSCIEVRCLFRSNNSVRLRIFTIGKQFTLSDTPLPVGRALWAGVQPAEGFNTIVMTL